MESCIRLWGVSLKVHGPIFAKFSFLNHLKNHHSKEISLGKKKVETIRLVICWVLFLFCFCYSSSNLSSLSWNPTRTSLSHECIENVHQWTNITSAYHRGCIIEGDDRVGGEVFENKTASISEEKQNKKQTFTHLVNCKKNLHSEENDKILMLIFKKKTRFWWNSKQVTLYKVTDNNKHF